MYTRKPRPIALSTEIIGELEEVSPKRLGSPYACGYGDAIDDAIRIVRCVRRKHGAKVSTEIIRELRKVSPKRTDTPRDYGYGVAIVDAIRIVRSVRVKRGLRAR
jgi:hypothetical protein